MVSRESLSLFGIDLVGIYEFWRDGIAEAVDSGWFRWLLRAEPVRVEHPDGRGEIRLGPDGPTLPGEQSASATAVVLPEDLYLSKDVQLPQLSSRQLAAALVLQAEQLSPFAGDDLAWGWRRSWASSGPETVRIVMASRSAVTGYLSAGGHAQPGGVEVWSGGSAPVVLKGFGEGRRLARQAAARVRLAVAAVLLLGLLLLLAAVPLRQAQARLEQATARLQQIQKEAEPAIATREKLVTSAAALERLRGRSPARAGEAEVLNELSALIPDEAMLFRFDLRGDQLRLSGQAADASRVLQLLADSKSFSSVRSTGPFSRASNGRESFMFEVQLHRGEGAS